MAYELRLNGGTIAVHTNGNNDKPPVLTQQDIEKAMEEIWGKGGKPETIQIAGVWYDVMSEIEELDRVCTPSGLRSLFPGLK